MGVKLNESDPISFPIWKEALASAPFPPETKSRYAREVIAFLGFCKRRHAPVTIMLIRVYLAEQERQGSSGAREALRWFFQAAVRRADGAEADGGQSPEAVG